MKKHPQVHRHGNRGPNTYRLAVVPRLRKLFRHAWYGNAGTSRRVILGIVHRNDPLALRQLA